jgi:hypothetical protein
LVQHGVKKSDRSRGESICIIYIVQAGGKREKVFITKMDSFVSQIDIIDRWEASFTLLLLIFIHDEWCVACELECATKCFVCYIKGQNHMNIKEHKLTLSKFVTLIDDFNLNNSSLLIIFKLFYSLLSLIHLQEAIRNQLATLTENENPIQFTYQNN